MGPVREQRAAGECDADLAVVAADDFADRK
jgi:hypothetical protein